MNLPKNFPELDELKEKMNAQIEPEIDMQLIDMQMRVGVNLTEDNLEIEGIIPIVKNRKVALYIREPKNYDRYRDLPKYHITNCKTLQEMRLNREYYKYHASHPTDGKFLVKLSNSGPLKLCKLTLCKNCLKQLRSEYDWNVFDSDPEKFPLEDWFEPFFYSSEDWKVRSQSCRENANWTCSECNINLESNPYLLHAHHEWGTRYNDPEDLKALCIGCHAEQPGGGHQMLKFYPDYQEFMTKYGEQWELVTN